MDLTRFSPTILLAISLLAVTAAHILKKVFNQHFETKTEVLFIYTLGNSLSAMIFLAFMGLSSISLFTLVVGLVFGIVTALQLICNLEALKHGPLSYTTVIVSLSSLIPTLSGVVIWKERIEWSQIVGIVLMIGCLVLSVDAKQEGKKTSLKWILWCMAAFVFTGIIGVIQKWQQNTAYRHESPAFLIVAFLCSAVVGAVLLCRERKQGFSIKVYCKWVPCIIMIASGLCVAVNNKFNLYLSGVMDSAVFFPIANGGALILVSLAAVILFKERLSLKQWIGIVLGIAAVIFLCNPFG